MDGFEDDSAGRGRLLLSQLDLIFVRDPLIDELGFVHPSQLAGLHSSEASGTGDSAFSKLESSNSSVETTSTVGAEGHVRADCSRRTKHEVDELDDDGGTSFDEKNADDGLPYDGTAFWCGEHKLAISMLAVAPMYKCCNAAFALMRTDYKKLLQAEQGAGVAECSQVVGSSEAMEATLEDNQCRQLKTAAMKLALEDSLMSYSRALVLINCDHASAWNSRKQIILSRAADQEVLSGELHLAGVVLSCGPKSEEAWAHRRWVLNQMINIGVPRENLDLLLEGESKLVEAVAGRSSMNYRAWRHRCWLVSQMSYVQVAIELHRTKLWATSHVADNCCFHYRRSLLLQLVKLKATENNQMTLPRVTAVSKNFDVKNLRAAPLDGSESRVQWKEEVDWIKNLIQQYVGREALWIHLRFLFVAWILHVGPSMQCPYWGLQAETCNKAPLEADDTVLSVGSEQHFVDLCLHACVSDLTEGGDRQREFAATYKLWVLLMGSRYQKENGKIGSQIVDNIELSSLQQLLHDIGPHRGQLWANLLSNFGHVCPDSPCPPR